MGYKPACKSIRQKEATGPHKISIYQLTCRVDLVDALEVLPAEGAQFAPRLDEERAHRQPHVVHGEVGADVHRGLAHAGLARVGGALNIFKFVKKINHLYFPFLYLSDPDPGAVLVALFEG